MADILLLCGVAPLSGQGWRVRDREDMKNDMPWKILHSRGTQGFSPPRIQQRKACPTSFTKASVANLTKPLLFGAADRGPQGENLKDFNNTSNPSLHDGLNPANPPSFKEAKSCVQHCSKNRFLIVSVGETEESIWKNKQETQ
ncbi:hypothetical protein NQZ68_017733 [Dissostichus eleginoides]|nr:hypothetical protein NQZ68_017733 [Dissostichus eleginoides]